MKPSGEEGELIRIPATDVNKVVEKTSMCARLFVAFLLIIFVSGCTKQAACNLQNNSGGDVTIIRSRAGEQDQRIDVKAGSSILLQDWPFWSYGVAKGGKVQRYTPQNPGTKFVETRGFGPWTKRVFNARLEFDGRIFVLSPGQSFSAKDFVEQPTGFPLVPLIEPAHPE